MRRKFSSCSAAFVEVDDLFCLDSYQSDRTISMSYIEADHWQRVSEEEVVTAAAKVEEQNRSSDLFSNSRSSLDPDQDLTNLNWLLGFSVSGPHHTVASQSSSPEEPAFTDVPQIPSKAAAYRRPDHQCPDEVDYKANPSVKPPYTYASMIYMAMQASDKPKITLSCIYKWIMDNFSYYRYAEPTWQNCIRHNLSLKKCFVKVPRKKNEPGKGGFWTIDPRHAVRLVIGAYKNHHMINPVLSNHPNITVQPESTFVSTRDDTRVNHESNQILKNMLMETDQDSCSAEVLWISEETEHLFGHSDDRGPPPFVLDQKEGQSSSTGPSELDPLLTSAWNEDLSVNYERPLSPVLVDKDLIIHGNHFSVQELLSDSSEHQEMLESHCSRDEADDPLLKSVLQNCLDLLASSAENMEPLYDCETTVQVQTQTFSQDHKAHLSPFNV